MLSVHRVNEVGVGVVFPSRLNVFFNLSDSGWKKAVVEACPVSGALWPVVSQVVFFHPHRE